MVVCATCGDAVAADAACPTCGGSDPRHRTRDLTDHLDEGLLNRVGEALRAQAALAARTAAERTARAAQLYDETVVLHERLRRQAALLRGLVAEHAELVPRLRGTLDRLDSALSEDDGEDPGRGRSSLSVVLPRDRSCPMLARRLLDSYVHEWLDREEKEDAILIVSELATNALQHGQGRIELNVVRLSDRLRIELRDQGQPESIAVVPEAERGTGGRGLWIVDQLASSWGVTDGAGRVWAELELPASGRVVA